MTTDEDFAVQLGDPDDQPCFARGPFLPEAVVHDRDFPDEGSLRVEATVGNEPNIPPVELVLELRPDRIRLRLAFVILLVGGVFMDHAEAEPGRREPQIEFVPIIPLRVRGHGIGYHLRVLGVQPAGQ